MPDDISKLVQEWLIRGSHDLQTAQIAFEAGAPMDSIAVLIQQATEKYLKGYLIYRGWNLKKTHDLRELIDRAIEYDAIFTDFLDTAIWLTAYYLEERYPPGLHEDYSREEIASILEQAERLVNIIKIRVT